MVSIRGHSESLQWVQVLCGSCRDVSSVEVLMNYHQSLKSEVEARSQSILECIEMGKTLLAARNPAAEEVRWVNMIKTVTLSPI